MTTELAGVAQLERPRKWPRKWPPAQMAARHMKALRRRHAYLLSLPERHSYNKAELAALQWAIDSLEAEEGKEARSTLESERAANAVLKKEIETLRSLIAYDAHACTFQSLGKYRTALLAAFSSTESQGR